MESILEEAEKLINTSADFQTRREYHENKNALLCGPFSSVVLLLQKENRKIRQQIDEIKLIKNMPLKENIINKVLAIANKIYAQKPTKIDSVKGSLKVLIHSMRANENITRADMRDLEISNEDLRRKIMQVKNTKVTIKKINKENIERLKERLDSISSCVSDSKTIIGKLESQNNELAKSNSEFEEQIKNNKEKLIEMRKIYKAKKESYDASIAAKKDLLKQLKKETNDVDKLILNQRYAGINFDENKDQMKIVLELKKEIEKQTEEKEMLLKRETDLRLKTIRKAQLRSYQTTYI